MWQGENPIQFVELEKADNARTRYLSSEELARLLKAIEVEPNRIAALMLRFLLLTGKRRGEALHLTRTDVDLERGIARYTRTKNGRTVHLPLSSQALVVVREALSLHSDERVFPVRSSWAFDKVFRKVRRRAKLQGFRCHDLRHAFASLAASSGQVDIYTLQNLLGHRSIAMTQRYAHLFPGALRGAVEVVGGLISPSQGF